MTGPLLTRPGAAEVRGALAENQVIAVPGVGGYQLAARPGGSGVPTLVALTDERAPDAVPYFAVGRMAQAGPLTPAWTPDIRRVAIRFWPGPLVVIVGESESSVRITMPADRAVRALCRRSGPLVMAAAHGADGRPLVDPDGVRSAFDVTDVALIVDGGTHEGPGPSVLDCRVSPPAVYEEGALPRNYMEAALIMGGRRRWMSRS